MPRSIAILMAGGLCAPTAWHLPEIFKACGEAWAPVVFVVAVGTPWAMAGVVAAIKAIRGNK